jgi:hypothetical protein
MKVGVTYICIEGGLDTYTHTYTHIHIHTYIHTYLEAEHHQTQDRWKHQPPSVERHVGEIEGDILTEILCNSV